MNDITFIISNPNKLRVSQIQIKENSAVKRMVFLINYLAYICDIDVQAAISHNNDVFMTTALDDFSIVDEVNEALEKVKNSMVDMDNYLENVHIFL
ncbi:hypothetical protein [uncultured Brachyspira sp.]|uniref:hypothetical protein n=1 Tax=uncultured Brachyspira sp. TaxID=221953 RepID=UPI0025FFF46D|nr:hypothetical protein [uncultured Brachyspira sp.]